MKNPFLEPHTVGEWLRSSLCWTGACLIPWWITWMVLDNVLPKSDNELIFIGMPLSFCVAHALIWWRAVAGGNALIHYDEQHRPFSLTRLAARLWFTALVVGQALTLAGLLAAGVLLLIGSQAAPSASTEPFFG
jgi:hypothetical protein